MHSAIYTGKLRHRRFKPTGNSFAYSVCLFYLDLAEVDSIFKWPLLAARRGPAFWSFRRANYLGDASIPLDTEVRNAVERETGVRPQGPIRLLTQITYVGYCFNPVSFYYCFDALGKQVEFIVTEITNTPWHERHTYVLRCKKDQVLETFSFQKKFHVSPFMPMDLSYEWLFSTPSEKLLVNMENFDNEAMPRLFDATLTLNRRPLTVFNFLQVTVAYPLMTFKTVILIYWQALKLWIKKIPFYSHPSKGVSS